VFEVVGRLAFAGISSAVLVQRKGSQRSPLGGVVVGHDVQRHPWVGVGDELEEPQEFPPALSRSSLRALEYGALTADEITELTDLPVASLSALARRELRPSTLE